jgi:hypothetical protein
VVCGSPAFDTLHAVFGLQKEITQKMAKDMAARCGARTHDHKVKSLALCQLS